MIIVAQSGTQLRAYEKPNLEKHFGKVIECGTTEAYRMYSQTNSVAEYLYWRPDTERTNFHDWQNMIAQQVRMNCKFINRVNHLDNVQSKDRAFEIWRRNNIPCPDWFVFENEGEFWDHCYYSTHISIPEPLLIRLNNSVTGYESYLVHDDNELEAALSKLLANYKKPKYNGGIDCKMMCVQFIETRKNGFRSSYRIIVAGDKVITGYARLAEGDDWIAITRKFSLRLAEDWIEANRQCEAFCRDNASLIIKAVHVLGLNFQGVDVIISQDGQPYFLEVQPGFSVGYLNAKDRGWLPPFYNPSQPNELVDFLIENKTRLRKEIPMYYKNWLDKNRMFDLSFQALKEHLG